MNADQPRESPAFRRGQEVNARIVFSGGTHPRTAITFPRGEAVHYAEHAVSLGVPTTAILVESRSWNTALNISLARELLIDAGVAASTVLLISKPYHKRRALATCRKVWPEVVARCASHPFSLDEYLDHVADTAHVVTMLVGEVRRLEEYPGRGYVVPEDVPRAVRAACDRLVARGFTGRLPGEKATCPDVAFGRRDGNTLGGQMSSTGE